MRMIRSAVTIDVHRVAWRLVCAVKAKNTTILRQRVRKSIQFTFIFTSQSVTKYAYVR